MGFSISLRLSLVAAVLLFAEHTQADLSYDPITGRPDIDGGMTESLYLDGNISLGLSLLAGAPLSAEPARPDSYIDPDTGRIDIGRASLFTVLAAGNINNDDSMSGSSYVEGNVGIGGTGKFKMSDGEINGDLYVRTTASSKLSGPATVHHVYHDPAHDAPIDNALADAQNLSDWAWMEMPTNNYTTNGNPFVLLKNVYITNANQSITLAAGAHTEVVLRLTDFVMKAGTFTLQGTATTTFIVNISGAFSLDNARILLAGIPAANVLFNIHGTGSQVTLNQGTQMSGILLATHRRVVLNGATVYGRVFADSINISGGARIISR
jgi:choice-of-anchor A domain-containing protein